MKLLKKQQLAVFLAAVLCIAAFSSCAGSAAPPAVSPVSAPSDNGVLEIKNISRQDILSKNFTVELKGFDDNGLLALSFIKDKYEDFEVTTAHAYFTEGSTQNMILKDLYVGVSSYEICFQTKTPVSGLAYSNCSHSHLEQFESSDSIYSENFQTIYVIDDTNGKMTLSAVDYNKLVSFDEIYEVLRADSRFADALLPKPKNELSANMKEINVTKLFHSKYKNIVYARMMNGQVLATVSQTPVAGSASEMNTELNFINVQTGGKVFATDSFIGNFHNFEIKNDKFVTYEYLPDEKKTNLRTYSPDGKVTMTIVSDADSKKNYLSDGSCILTENCNLYLLDEKTKVKKLLVKGVDSENVDAEEVRFKQEIDKNRFVYYIVGYEWAAGIGIYDIATHTDHRIDYGNKFIYPSAAFSDYVYTSDLTMGVPFNLHRTDVKTMESISIYEDDPGVAEQIFTFSISHDQNKIAVAKDGGNMTTKIEIYSLPDFELLQTETIRSEICSLQYLEFGENNKLYMYTERYAMQDYYFFEISLK